MEIATVGTGLAHICPLRIQQLHTLQKTTQVYLLMNQQFSLTAVQKSARNPNILPLLVEGSSYRTWGNPAVELVQLLDRSLLQVQLQHGVVEKQPATGHGGGKLQASQVGPAVRLGPALSYHG